MALKAVLTACKQYLMASTTPTKLSAIAAGIYDQSYLGVLYPRDSLSIVFFSITCTARKSLVTWSHSPITYPLEIQAFLRHEHNLKNAIEVSWLFRSCCMNTDCSDGGTSSQCMA